MSRVGIDHPFGGDGRLVALAGADAVDPLHGHHEDLAVAHLAGAGRFEDGLDGRLDERFADPDLEPYLLGKLHLDGRPPVGLDVLGLASVPVNAGHGKAVDLGFEEGLQHVVQLLRSNDRDDQLHLPPPCLASTRIAPSPEL